MIRTLVTFYKSLQNILFSSFRRNPIPSSTLVTPTPSKEVLLRQLAGSPVNPLNLLAPVGIAPTERTAPILISEEERQPVRLFKKFAPLRYSSESTLEQIEHQTLHYNADSVVFIAGERTEYAYYLLQGSIELRPDGVFAYTVICDTAQSCLP